MKSMPIKELPADECWTYVPDQDDWIVQKKSGNVVLSKKETSLIILARLEEIHANLLKQAIQQQDIVDFYLLSLLPPEYLSGDEIGTEHYDALSIFKSIIMSLREEYIDRGMDELKDEAKTTAWVKAIPEVDMPEEIKPYYKYHDEPFPGRYSGDIEEDDGAPYSCSSCGTGLYEDDVYIFGDEYYCSDCESEAVDAALKLEVGYCATHNVFLNDNADLHDFLVGMNSKVDSFENHLGPEHQVTRYDEGLKIWQEVRENAKKQLQLQFEERKKRRKQRPPEPNEDAYRMNTPCANCGQSWGDHFGNTCPNLKGKFVPAQKQLKLRPEENPKSIPGEPNPPPVQGSLKQAGEGRYLGEDKGWWEAPRNFDNYSSSDYYKIFKLAPWKAMYGGPLWAEVARTINEMEHTTDWQKLMVLIDHFHDLGHNTGKLLDKFPEWHQWFKRLLDEKAKKNSLRYLLQRASGPVKNLVTDYLRTHGKTWVEEKEEKDTEFKVGEDVLLFINNKPIPVIITEVYNDGSYYVKDNQGAGTQAEGNELKHMPIAVSSLNRPLSKKSVSFIKNVLIICSGNTCRSPMAENILRSIRPDLNVVSRGLYVSKGGPMSSPAEEALKEKGIPFQPHLSKQVTEGDVNTADLILTMEQWQKEELVQLFPQARSKTFLLGSQEIKDPIGGTAEEYKKIRDEIAQELGKMGSLDKFSKSHYGEEAICPTCGDWKPTDFSPEELKEREWECLDCMNKRLTRPEDLPENRGQKEITTFDPEYEWLLKLISVVTKAGVPASEIKALSVQHPFVTIDDAGDLAAQIWTLATEKYHIPREWLMKKLPAKKASLSKKAYEGGYPTEEDATYWGGGPQGTVAYEPAKHDSQTGRREGDTGEPIVICPRCKSNDLNKEGEKATCNACGTNFIPKPDRGSDDQTVNDYSQNYFWGPNDLGRSHQNQPGANGWLPAGQEDADGPSPNIMMSSFKSFMHKQSVINKLSAQWKFWIDPAGKEYPVKKTHYDWIAEREGLESDSLEIDSLSDMMMEDGWTRITPGSEAGGGVDFAMQVGDLKNIPPYLDDFVAKYFRGKPIGLSDRKNHYVLIDDPFPSLSKVLKYYKIEASLNKVAHCGPCSVLKMEALHILIDLYYKENDLFPEEVIEELSIAATELKVDNFNDILESVITEYLEEKAEAVGDKLPKLKNLLIALKDIAPKLGKEIEVVDKQAMLKQASDDVQVGNILWSDNTNYPILVSSKKLDAYLDLIKNMQNTSDPDQLEDMDVTRSEMHYDLIIYAIDKMEQEKTPELEFEVSNIISSFVEDIFKQASLKKAAKEEYPKISKPKSGYVDNGIGYTCGRCEYFNPEREKCKKVEGTIKSFGCCNFWDGEGKFKEKNKTAEKKELETDKRALTKEEAVYVEYPNVDYRCDECMFFNAEAKTCTKVDGEISPTASCNFWQPIKNKQANLIKQARFDSPYWIDPNGKEYPLQDATHDIWVERNQKMLKGRYGIDFSKMDKRDSYTSYMLDQGWTRAGVTPEGILFHRKDLNNIDPLNDFVAKHWSQATGQMIQFETYDIPLLTIDDPFPSLEEAISKTHVQAKQASLLDEVLDQTTQDAIAAEYGPQILIALRFYNDAVRYGQSPDRAMAYALEESKRMHRPVEQGKFLEVLNTYF